VLSWLGLISGALPLLATVLKPIPLAPLVFIRDHVLTFWVGALSAVAVALLIWVIMLQRRFATRFKENFKKPLNLNWDYQGSWHVGEEGVLTITGSPVGGVTKVGALWENYTLSFKAKIIRKCLGVIVRAQDLDNYNMFQILTDRIRPHRRIALPVQAPASQEGEPNREGPPTETVMRMVPVPYVVVWQVMDEIATPLSKQLTDWFSIDVTVRGESVQIYIDDEMVFERESLLKIPMGKIGFRNSGNEQALVRDVRVRIQA
jgi:hypothetical protein